MVYCGKLSTACERCRQRRIKCDEREPQCSQCIRAQHPCPGYRDILSLSFRNQNEDVIRKAQKAKLKASRPRPAKDQKPSATKPKKDTSKECTEVRTPESIDLDLPSQKWRGPTSAPSKPVRIGGRELSHMKFESPQLAQLDFLDDLYLQEMSIANYSSWTYDLAHSFVMNNYLFDDIDAGNGKSFLSYINDVRVTENKPAINAAISALGLASLANIEMSPGLMASARKEYATALRWTNSMLRDPASSTADSTLAAVILLGMFETITCDGPKSVQSWRNHLRGATKLLELRGVDQLKRPQGLQMFTHLRTQILINNIYWETDTSPFIAELTAEAEQLRDPDDVELDRIANIVVRLSNFSAGVRKGRFVYAADIISQALALDAELVTWAVSVPAHYVYSTVDVTPDSSDALKEVTYGPQYHVYTSSSVAAAWNHYRCSRMLVQSFLLKALEMAQSIDPSRGEYASVSLQSRTILAQTAEDICASVPYHLGAWKSSAAGSRCSTPTTQSSRSNSPMGFGGIDGFDFVNPSTPPTSTPSSCSSSYSPSYSSSYSSSPFTHGFKPFSSSSPQRTPTRSGYIASGGYLLIWPLILAGEYEYAPAGLREWTFGCLEKIGYLLGIRQALAMLALLRENKDSRTLMQESASRRQSIEMLMNMGMGMGISIGP